MPLLESKEGGDYCSHEALQYHQKQTSPPKDKVQKEEKSGVVYNISCSECESSYVGETERSLKNRLVEHKRSSSPVGHHMDYNKHSFADAEVSVIHQETGWFCRGMAKAIHITKLDPNLNRDRGHHHLPAIYREIFP